MPERRPFPDVASARVVTYQLELRAATAALWTEAGTLGMEARGRPAAAGPEPRASGLTQALSERPTGHSSSQALLSLLLHQPRLGHKDVDKA